MMGRKSGEVGVGHIEIVKRPSKTGTIVWAGTSASSSNPGSTEFISSSFFFDGIGLGGVTRRESAKKNKLDAVDTATICAMIIYAQR